MAELKSPHHPLRISAISCAVLAAALVLPLAASAQVTPGPPRSYLSSNDFLTGGSPLNGAVIVTSPAAQSNLNAQSLAARSGFDPAGYLARARVTNAAFPLGDFQPILQMSEHRQGAGAVLARGPIPRFNPEVQGIPGPPSVPPLDSVSYLYIVGGLDQGVASATIERAQIDANGTIRPGLGLPAGFLTAPRYGAAVVARGDYIYVIGGYDGADLPVQTIERFQIDPSGNLLNPVLQQSPGWGGDVSAVIVNGYLYVLGGTSSKRGPAETVLASVKRAPIDPQGTLAPFEEIGTAANPSVTLQMPVGVAGGRAVAVAGLESGAPVYSIYYLGGNVGQPLYGASQDVYRLKVAPDDSIPGDWAKVPQGSSFVQMIDARELFAAVATNGYLYAIGGESTTNGMTIYYSHVERAAIGADGTIGAFVRLDGANPTYINQFDRASDMNGVALNNNVYVAGGRDSWGFALNEIFQLNLDQGGSSLLADPVLDASVFGLVSDLGQETKIHSLVFDVGPDKALAADIYVRFRSAPSAGAWGAWTPYFSISSLPPDFAPANPVAGVAPYLLDLTYAPGVRSCMDASLIPNPTLLTDPVTARYMEYEVIIPQGGADQKLHRLAVDPRPIVHFALPGGYDPTVISSSHPPSCAPSNAIADMGIASGWVRFTGIGLDGPGIELDSDTVRFVSTGTTIPITAREVQITAAGRVIDVRLDIGSGAGGPYTYDLVYVPMGGVSDPVTLLSPAIKVYPAVQLVNAPGAGLDVHPGNGVARENVVQAPTPQTVKAKFTVALFGENFRSGRVDESGPQAVDDPGGTGTWPSNPFPAAGSQVPVLKYTVIDRTTGPAGFEPLKLWNEPVGTWIQLPMGAFGSASDLSFDLEVNTKSRSGPHNLEITVQNPQLGSTVTVNQTVYVVPAFGVQSFQTRKDPTPDPNPGAPSQYDWTGSKNPAVADLGDGVGNTLTIDVTGYGFQSDSGSSLITGIAPVSNVYAPSAGTYAVSDPADLNFAASVPINAIPKLHHFTVGWSYELGVSDPYTGGVQVPPVWDGPGKITTTWTPESNSWIGLYVVPPRVKIHSILGAHNTNNPIVVLQSDPTLTVNGDGFAVMGPAVGGFATTLHDVRLISMANSPDEDIQPVSGGVHMVSDCQARLTMNVLQTQRPGEMYMLEITTHLPDLETAPGTAVRHPYSIDQSATPVTVLPLPVCGGVAPSCLSAQQGTRLNGVVVTGANFDLATVVDLGPGVTIENLDVCHDDPARGCVAQDKLTFDAVVSPLATPGHRLVLIENGPTSSVSQQASCATPANDFWVVPVPTITQVSPSMIQQPPMAAGVKMIPIDIYGTNFVPGATIQVTLAGGSPTGDVTANGHVVVVDSGHITAELLVKHAAQEGGYSLSVGEPSGPACGTATMTANGSFQVTPFREISMAAVSNQMSQCQGRSGTLSVTGSNFKDPADIVLVSGASLGPNVSIDSLSVDSATQITIKYSIGRTAALGSRPLVLTPVTQGATPATWPDALAVTSSPSVVSVSPRSIISGTERQVTITGRNFFEGGAAVEVSPGTGVTVSEVQVVNSGQILATIAVEPNMLPESRSITVTNADGGQCAVATFNAAIQIVDPPHVTSWKFNAPQLKIVGSNFHPSIQAYVGGSTTPWPKLTVKKNSTIILGGAQKTFKKGTSVDVRLVNPDDGGETTFTVTR